MWQISNLSTGRRKTHENDSDSSCCVRNKNYILNTTYRYPYLFNICIPVVRFFKEVKVSHISVFAGRSRI